MKSICCPSFLLFRNSGVDQLDASDSRSHLVSAKLSVRSVPPLKTQVGAGSSSKITPMLVGGVQLLAGYRLEAPLPSSSPSETFHRAAQLAFLKCTCRQEVRDRSHCLSGYLITEAASRDCAMLGLVAASHWVQPTL